MHLVLLSIVGGLAVWLASRRVRGDGLGPWGKLGLGVTGARLGEKPLGPTGARLIGPFGPWLTVLLGAVLLLWAARLFGK